MPCPDRPDPTPSRFAPRPAPLRALLTALALIVVMSAASAVAQGGACSAPEASQFDFWLGEWELSWPAEQTGGEAGATATGTNVIEKILDGCVVQENFSVEDGSYRGRSVSLYSAPAGEWRQTWVDTGGAYLLFSGGFEDGRMELRTEPREIEGATVVNRMVFSDIAEDSLAWAWQRSDDGGESWTDLWTIGYRRR